MRICQRHWDMLRDAIDERGLGDLVAKDGEAAMRNMVEELEEGKQTARTFDPLMNANWAICNNVMRFVGLAVMYPDEDGEPRCPLCFLTEQHKEGCTDPDCEIEDYDDWIEKAADEQAEAWASMQKEGAG